MKPRLTSRSIDAYNGPGSANIQDAGAMARPAGDPNDLNRVLQMAAWLLLAVTSLMVCFRLLTRFFLRSNKVFSLEEGLAFFAYVFSLGESVTVLLPESRIIGKEISEFSPEELKQGLRAIYVGDILFIVAIGLSKLSMSACLVSLSPDRVHIRLISILGILIVLWTLTSVLASGLRCGGRLPWESQSGGCISLHAFLNYLDVSNIVTDAGLLVLSAVMIYPLNMPMRTRISVLAVFGSRVFVIIPTIMRLAFLSRLFEPDYTLRAFPYFLCTQIIQLAAISTNCIVYFWPLLHSLRTGLMWADNLGVTGSPRYVLSDPGRQSGNNNSGRGSGSRGGGVVSTFSRGWNNASISKSQGSESTLPVGLEHEDHRPGSKNYVEITRGFTVDFDRAESG